MSPTRIYTAQPLSVNETICLDKSASHYVVNVLRLRDQAAVIVFNGDSREYDAIVTAANPKAACLHIQQQRVVNTESALSIHLAQGLSRGERMDYVVQKAVELGVASITPLFTEFCQVKLEATGIQKRLAHWQGVIISACEQSGRVRVPVMHAPMRYADYLSQHINDYLLVCHPTGEDNISSLKKPKDKFLSLLIGPEGGFSEREIQDAKQVTPYHLCLGPRVLRTETATVAALSILQSHWGDI